ncbi:rhodanese-like domain-containing protein [Neptunomonas antarctica]|uniref:Rhodanese-related sulfurtransferase n=1 Tax=Neptunomonas antarctica TaxID=619304 RepID=A0A1N7JG80_9GAMM|nr:rhodanese-like domain-containing protein [Neptunomonas antarctica]SIS48308.1 Rhodanese-related sulfurtransferase [Neptunomonas antarctica]
MKIKDWLSFKPVPQISAETLHTQLKSEHRSLFLLDVRSHTEWKLSHIEASHCIPVFNVNISKIPKDKTIICICLTAHRSTPVARELLRHGYDVYELSGGMRAWWQQNYPTL